MNKEILGIEIGNYKLNQLLGEGGVGSVYHAQRLDNIPEERAIKLIAESNLRPNWENEISKVVQLQRTPGVVRYYEHGGPVEIGGQNYVWISWDFIPGDCLRDLLKAGEVTVPMLLSIVETVLQVLHACQSVGVQHGDLHSGNILIERASEMRLDSSRREVLVTDFGYCTASMGTEMLDDFMGLVRIIRECCNVIDHHAINGANKRIRSALMNDFTKWLEETNSTEGSFVRNPKELMERLNKIRLNAPAEPDKQEKHIADYLAAELIGERYDEWRALFVPEFLARSTILDRNITVVTGLRGCGKTMIFRRLSALFECHLGPSGVPHSDSFVGCYLNARVIAEAFPWLPHEQEAAARRQVIHFFHLSWCLEIVDWLIEEAKKRDLRSDWLYAFLVPRLNAKIPQLGPVDFQSIRSFLERELIRAKLHSKYDSDEWPLSDIGFLEDFAKELATHLEWIGDRPFYFFLDDYSTPLVTPQIQRILNAIVFRRSARVIFKIATESAESFVPVGLNNKKLEENDDFVLIDFGMQALLSSDDHNMTILSAVLEPRIDRDKHFRGQSLDLKGILGSTEHSYVDLANLLRGEPDSTKQESGHTDLPVYHGAKIFCAMWSSDIREMIRLFANMVSLEDANKYSKVKDGLISKEVQNKAMREAGGKYLSLLEAATNPSERMYALGQQDPSYGHHLVEIARAFQEVARHELLTKQAKNMGSAPPKQARRIEITAVEDELPENLHDYYRGMIRYGLFTRDTRGKSVRGKVVPRLYLRGLLIPYFTITFSKRDAITMNWDDFCEFLREPNSFATKWKQKSGSGSDEKGPLLPGFE